MFKQEKERLPYCEIAHLLGESLSFATALRGAKPAGEPVKVRVSHSSRGRGKGGDSGGGGGGGRGGEDEHRETNCTNSGCLGNNLHYAEALQQDFEERLAEQGAQYTAAQKKVHLANDTAALLMVQEQALKSRRSKNAKAEQQMKSQHDKGLVFRAHDHKSKTNMKHNGVYVSTGFV
ncbi:hypothetical protein B484DRAFT_426780 [Ochromonadaceae sp. CCMP2298]|nr:hypothetical protein B484DRAFT_426780 [Ochromonadaceae sp. CCMP2298]